MYFRRLTIAIIAEWLMGQTVQKLIVVVSNVATSEVVERWQFDIECDKSYKENR